jgi:hypothetical protein
LHSCSLLNTSNRRQAIMTQDLRGFSQSLQSYISIAAPSTSRSPTFQFTLLKLLCHYAPWLWGTAALLNNTQIKWKWYFIFPFRLHLLVSWQPCLIGTRCKVFECCDDYEKWRRGCESKWPWPILRHYSSFAWRDFGKPRMLRFAIKNWTR